MNIAEKLAKVKENVQKVYDAGFEAGKSEGEDTTEAYNNGYADGQTAEYNRFWDKYQDKGRTTAYDFAFAGRSWTDAVYNPKYDINATGSGTYMFNNNQTITDTKVPITITVSSINNVFATCRKLKTIPSLKVTSNVIFTSWFGGCDALETINFTSDSVIANNLDIHWSTKLSAESIESILNAVSPSANITITLPYTAPISYGEKYGDDAWGNYIAEFKASKPNVTIAYL